MRGFGLAALAAILLLATPALAGTVFSDDFESGNLDKWTGKGGGAHNAVLVADPLSAGNTAIYFTAVNSAGDIFEGNPIAVSVGQLMTLSFDYLGPASVEGGGYIGYSTGLPSTHTWLAGTGNVSGAAPILVDDGTWHSYSITFASNYTSVRVMVEDFATNSIARNAYFDNIELATVPLPSAALMGLGLLAFAGAFRRFRRR